MKAIVVRLPYHVLTAGGNKGSVPGRRPRVFVSYSGGQRVIGVIPMRPVPPAASPPRLEQWHQGCDQWLCGAAMPSM